MAITFSENDMLSWLCEKDPRKLEELFKEARACAVKYVGPKVYFRGLIEFSNICSKNCYYCGIRRDNKDLKRFTMSEGEILEAAKAAYDMGYGSVVLQSGERQDPEYTKFIEALIRKIKALSANELGITLSLGEQDPETYERWFRAGAHRYLLRIETSSPSLYKKLHPEDHSFEERMRCLRTLREVGYQVGTGVMIGLPYQTLADLADDILFFQREDVAMIGMGPYIPHADAPLGKEDKQISTPPLQRGVGGDLDQNPPSSPFIKGGEERFRLGLVMIALTRLVLKDVNIAAATALQTLDPIGREKGIAAGANIIMPNITPTVYRSLYKLYDNKPCLDEDARKCRACLENRLSAHGCEIGYREWGDSPHFVPHK
jgi:biotin synthase